MFITQNFKGLVQWSSYKVLIKANSSPGSLGKRETTIHLFRKGTGGKPESKVMESGRRNINFRASTGAYTLLGPVKTEEKLPPHKGLSDAVFSSHPQFLYCGDFWCHKNLNPNKILVKERNHEKARSYYYLINT